METKKRNEKINNNLRKTGSQEGTHVRKVKNAIRRAKADGKKVFLVFTGKSKNYNVCKKMDKEVFNTDRGKKVMKNFVVCRVDVDKEPETARHYGWTPMIPKYMVIDGSGKILKKDTGYSTAARFYRWLSR